MEYLFYVRGTLGLVDDNTSIDSDVGNIILNNSQLFNAMIHPFTRMAVKGALWYQGKFVY